MRAARAVLEKVTAAAARARPRDGTLATACRSLALLALLGPFQACGGSWPVPPEMSEEELIAHLLPRGDERLVVANFWASW